MKNRTILKKRTETYYNIFISISNGVRKSISQIAKDVRHTGRGRRRATIFKYLQDMYERQITFYPNLLLKTFENPKWKAFFLKKSDEEEIFGSFKKLSGKVSYALFLSGRYDYFVTCRENTVDFDRFEVEIARESTLYTPVFTKPSGWNRTFEDVAEKICNLTFEKGYLDRPKYSVLRWDDLDFGIFELMKDNAREEYTKVAEKLKVTSATVKRRFVNNVVPHCEFAHYFFPKGYKYYSKTFFLIRSRYEKSLVEAFHLLPCTTYVYPLEEEIGCIIFHRNINDLMTMMEKLKLEKVIDSFSMFTPLRYD